MPKRRGPKLEPPESDATVPDSATRLGPKLEAPDSRCNRSDRTKSASLGDAPAADSGATSTPFCSAPTTHVKGAQYSGDA